MRLLILGGSWFLGRRLAVDALRRGWHITSFSRGRSGRPPGGVVHVLGDRALHKDRDRLAEFGPWDATIDTSSYEPADVVAMLDALGTAAGRYVLVSTVSAYRDWPAQPVSEASPVWPSRLDARESDPDVAALPVPFQYGVLKANGKLAQGVSAAVGGCSSGPSEIPSPPRRGCGIAWRAVTVWQHQN